MDSAESESKPRTDRVAQIISLITISPFQIVMYMAFSTIICVDYLDRIILDTFSGIFYLLIPLIPLLYVSNKYKSDNYSIPKKGRSPLFLVQIIGFIGASLFYYYYQTLTGLNAEILFVFTVGYVVLNAICWGITLGLKFKISLHLTGASSSITGIVIVFVWLWGWSGGWWWGWLYLLCIPIAWSRIKLRAHTRAQVIWGTILGILVIFLTYLGFGYIF